jgi:pyruvate/2-oxoglutarate dehydrogenase complex dihydrolipoamide acyltransferase (E2) component
MELTQYSGQELSVARHPDTVLAEASLVAKSVDRLVKSRPDLVQVIGGRKHPRFELLQIVGSMFRVTVRVAETHHIVEPDGWDAVAEAVHVPTGQVLARGEGMCTTDEPSWHMRPKYEWRNGKREKVGEEPITSHQRRSMAQTRACSKALRLALGWVLGLAGYEATAAEELTEDAEPAAAPQVRRKSQRQQPQQAASAQPETISVEQQKLLWAAARGRGLTDQQLAEILEVHGYRRTAEIRREDLDKIMDDIAKAPPAASQSEPFDLAARGEA